jgi:hypothetical protein
MWSAAAWAVRFQAEFFHPPVESLARESELARRLRDDASSACEGLFNVGPVDCWFVSSRLRVSREVQCGHADRRLA